MMPLERVVLSERKRKERGDDYEVVTIKHQNLKSTENPQPPTNRWVLCGTYSIPKSWKSALHFHPLLETPLETSLGYGIDPTYLMG